MQQRATFTYSVKPVERYYLLLILVIQLEKEYDINAIIISNHYGGINDEKDIMEQNDKIIRFIQMIAEVMTDVPELKERLKGYQPPPK